MNINPSTPRPVAAGAQPVAPAAATEPEALKRITDRVQGVAKEVLPFHSVTRGAPNPKANALFNRAVKK